MVFMIFQKGALMEVTLQNTMSSAHRVLIDKKLFNVHKSFYLEFSATDYQWQIHSTDDYELIHHHKSCSSIEIKPNQIINIQTGSGDILKGITCDSAPKVPSYEKYDISAINELTVGKSPENTVRYEFLNIISQTQFKLVRENGTFVLYDLSSNGVYVNHRRVNNAYALRYGDTIEVFGLKLVYLRDVLAIGSVSDSHEVSESLNLILNPTTDVVVPSRKHKDTHFNRSPRIFPAISREEVVISQPNAPQFSKKRSLLTTIGPSFTMAIPMLLGCGLAIFSTRMNGGSASAFMFTGIITAVGAAVLGAFWAFMNIRETKKNEIAEETQRFNLYGNYLVETADYIKEKYRLNTASMHAMYPSSKECCDYNENSSELWNRNMTHEDFLFCRLGLGDVDFQVDIKIPQDKFSTTSDLLRDKPALLYENFKVMKDVPVGVNLNQSSLFGIVGGKHKKGVYQVVNNIIAQLTANNSYTDVKIAFCYDEDKEQDKSAWEYIKWFPHVWSENRKFRYYATNKQEVADVFFEISNVLRARAEEKSDYTEKKDYKPHYVLFISDVSMLEGELIAKYIYDKHNDYGLTTVILTDYYQNLPNICEDIIENDDDFCGSYNVFRNTREAVSMTFDTVAKSELLSFAKKISSIKVRDVENDTSIPNTLSFMEMYGVDSLKELNISDRWRDNRTYDSMRALIGKKAGGSPTYLDVHEKYHGPHGLIAGTTGSGKSEIIQTFMLSLAINFSPEDISFFVIDFKGGGMANLFSDLPHMVGQISNLSGNQISRAMISIKSENLRRQKLFSDYGVNNINNYTRLYKNGEAAVAIPHLFIIIDEFAELKKEEPDFMRELISVAQVGRSLGVHLVLATQKPSGTVDDNIWSNSKFKLCLRVQDRQDSNDMLHKPDAAYITQAGRCYLQVGNDEVYELFQSGYSGAVFEESVDRNQDIATIITPTGKTAIIGSLTRMKRKEKDKRRWFEFLLTELSVVSGGADSHEATDYEMAQIIIRNAQKRGYNIGDSPSELRAMQNFIVIATQNKEPSKENIDRIMEFASKNNLKLPEVKDKTQLEAIVKYISELAQRENSKPIAQLWMPLLKTNIALSEISDEMMITDKGYVDAEKGTLQCIVGMYDDPQNQSQLPFRLDFAEGGHLAVCGSVVSGKSTFLQTMVFSLVVKYSPEHVNFYLLDFSSGMLSVFENLPHVGGVIKENDIDRTEKFFNMIAGIIEQRKKMFKGGNYNQYVRAFNVDVPLIMIAIDNYAVFREKTENKFEDLVMRISREGVGYGIHLVLTAAGFGISEIPSRIADNFREVVSLEMSDKFKYMDVLRTTKIDVIPESGIKGRGIAHIDGRLLEFQTAVAVEAEDAYKRNGKIERICAQIKHRWSGACAKEIPYIPENPTYENLRALDQYRECIGSQDKLPLGYNFVDASVYSVDLKNTYCYCISGKKRTGKTNALKTLMAAAFEKNAECVVIEKSTNELKSMAKINGAGYLQTDMEILRYFQDITSDFIARNVMKKELDEAGLDDTAIFEKMQQHKQRFIFIADISEFIQDLYNHDNSIGNMSGFFENIFEKGILHNIYFFGCINTDNTAIVTTYKAYQLFTSYKAGMHLGGNVAAQRIFNFQNISYMEVSKPMKKGEALVPLAEDDTISQKVIVPLFGGAAQ
ncbi:MAG: type VII secretion protein EssC [Ruminococcus sp.]|nr:type VII secretion protein EssC [Ruminococcus sp.]